MLRDIGIIMLCSGVVLLTIALVLIFVLRIPDLLDELSGRKAKRQIKRLKELNVGTGSLEGMATDDVYMAISSGSLLSEEIRVKTEKDSDISEDVSTTGNIQKAFSESVDSVSGSIVSSGEEETSPVARVFDVSNISDSVDKEENPTDFMDDEEGVTSYVGDGEVTGMLNEVQEFVANKKNIVIIEEQTSLI